MSKSENTALLELAAEHRNYWEGTTFGKVLEAYIERGDLEGLQEHLKESAGLMAEAVRMSPEPITDETADQLDKEGLGYDETY